MNKGTLIQLDGSHIGIVGHSQDGSVGFLTLFPSTERDTKAPTAEGKAFADGIRTGGYDRVVLAVKGRCEVETRPDGTTRSSVVLLDDDGSVYCRLTPGTALKGQVAFHSEGAVQTYVETPEGRQLVAKTWPDGSPVKAAYATPGADPIVIVRQGPDAATRANFVRG